MRADRWHQKKQLLSPPAKRVHRWAAWAKMPSPAWSPCHTSQGLAKSEMCVNPYGERRRTCPKQTWRYLLNVGRRRMQSCETLSTWRIIGLIGQLSRPYKKLRTAVKCEISRWFQKSRLARRKEKSSALTAAMQAEFLNSPDR